ncbi:MAG: hypothetical protein KGV44_09350 [Flavobacteriaceae bacterium]|nr:hypothetical protein [Flavobacteriaceae bacterium]
MNSREYLQSLVSEALSQTDRGGKTKKILREIVEAVNEQPLLLWDIEAIEPLSQVALRVLLLDVIEDEEAEIAWVNKSFAYITQALLKAREDGKTDAELFDILKNRVVLLHSHDDFFVDILDYFFFHNTPIEKETDRADRRAFVLQRISAMQVCDLQTLEKYDKQLKNDAYLLEVEQNLLDKYQFSANDLMEAQLLSDALFKYIWHQLSKVV